MPRSALTVLLVVLTLLAFAGHFYWLDDPPRATVLDTLGMLLTIASTASIVRDAGSFDSRAFHRTRPGGDARAFRIASFGLLCPVLGVALMATTYGIAINLGWPHTWRFAAASSLPVLLCTTGFATGFSLIFSGDSRRVPTALVLLVPAFVAAIGMAEAGLPWLMRRRFAPGLAAYHPGSVLYVLTWGTLLGAAGYGLAWWLAVRRRWHIGALTLAASVGAYIPLAPFLGFIPYPADEPLPQATAQITRTAPVANPLETRLRDLFRNEYRKRRFEDSAGPEEVPILLGGRLHVQGLREGEFIASPGLVPGPQSDPPAKVGEGWVWMDGQSASHDSWGDTLILSAESTSGITARRAILAQLARRLPAPTSLRLNHEGEDETHLDWISVDEKQISIEEVEASTWQVNGGIFRMEDGGSYGLAQGGWHRFASGGAVRVMPYEPDGVENAIALRIIKRPSGGGDLFGSGRYSGAFVQEPVAILHDPLTGEALVLDATPDSSSFSGSWLGYKLSLRLYRSDIREPWQEKILRCRLYIFKPVPVSRVNVSLPPP